MSGGNKESASLIWIMNGDHIVDGKGRMWFSNSLVLSLLNCCSCLTLGSKKLNENYTWSLMTDRVSAYRFIRFAPWSFGSWRMSRALRHVWRKFVTGEDHESRLQRTTCVMVVGTVTGWRFSDLLVRLVRCYIYETYVSSKKRSEVRHFLKWLGWTLPSFIAPADLTQPLKGSSSTAVKNGLVV